MRSQDFWVLGGEHGRSAPCAFDPTRGSLVGPDIVRTDGLRFCDRRGSSRRRSPPCCFARKMRPGEGPRRQLRNSLKTVQAHGQRCRNCASPQRAHEAGEGPTAALRLASGAWKAESVLRHTFGSFCFARACGRSGSPDGSVEAH